MRFFRDGHGRDWCLNLDAPALNRVKQSAGVDLRDLHAGDVPPCFRTFVSLMQVLWAILGPQAKREKVSVCEFEWMLIDRESDARSKALIAVASSALLWEVAGLLPADEQIPFVEKIAEAGIR